MTGFRLVKADFIPEATDAIRNRRIEMTRREIIKSIIPQAGTGPLSDEDLAMLKDECQNRKTKGLRLPLQARLDWRQR